MADCIFLPVYTIHLRLAHRCKGIFSSRIWYLTIWNFWVKVHDRVHNYNAHLEHKVACQVSITEIWDRLNFEAIMSHVILKTGFYWHVKLFRTTLCLHIIKPAVDQAFNRINRLHFDKEHYPRRPSSNLCLMVQEMANRTGNPKNSC